MAKWAALQGFDPFAAWQGVSDPARLAVELQNPRLAQQGLGEAMAQQLLAQGGDQNEMLARQIQANPQAGLNAMGLMQRRGLEQAEAFRRAAAGSKLGSEALSERRLANALAGGGSPGMGGAQAASDMDIARMLAAGGKTDQAGKFFEFHKYKHGSAEDLRSRRADQRKYSTEARGVMNQLASLETIDPSNPAWEYSLTIITNKLLQPDSAVLLGESQAAISGLVSHFESLKQEAKRIVEATGSLPDEKRRELTEMTRNLGRAYLDVYRRTQDEWARQDVEDFQMSKTRQNMRPGRAWIGDVDRFLSENPFPLPAGGRGLIGGRIYQTKQGPAKWIAEDGEFELVGGD